MENQCNYESRPNSEKSVQLIVQKLKLKSMVIYQTTKIKCKRGMHDVKF